MVSLIIAISISGALLCVTTLFHWEILTRLALAVERPKHLPRQAVLFVIIALIVTHIMEIGLYAAGSVFASTLGLGALTAEANIIGPLEHFYFSAETFSTLGYGDIVPMGEVRLIASIEPLNGLMLLAWSGSFLFALVQKISAYRPDNAGDHR